MTQGGSSDANRHQTSSKRCFKKKKKNLTPSSLVLATFVLKPVCTCSPFNRLLQSQEEIISGKPTWVPTSFFCHCVSANSSTYHPTKTCCFYNHPESSRQCQNPKNIRAGYLKGWKKKKSSFSSVLWLSGHRWNTKCPPDVFLILWYIYRFSGSYQETAHANSTNWRK